MGDGVSLLQVEFGDSLEHASFKRVEGKVSTAVVDVSVCGVVLTFRRGGVVREDSVSWRTRRVGEGCKQRKSGKKKGRPHCDTSVVKFTRANSSTTLCLREGRAANSSSEANPVLRD